MVSRYFMESFQDKLLKSTVLSREAQIYATRKS